MLGKILIADRGEAALRVLRTCRVLGVHTVAAYSERDRNADYLHLADEMRCIGPADPRRSYLDGAAVVAAAQHSGAEAIHPGDGPLAENPDFAAYVEAAGLTFVGARPETTRLMQDEPFMREVMQAVGLPCLPRAEVAPTIRPKALAQLAATLGYPIAVRSLRDARLSEIARNDAELVAALAKVRDRGEALLGEREVLLEKVPVAPRRIGFQLLADAYRNTVHLGTFEATLQRFQRCFVAEAPPAGLAARSLGRIAERCVEAARRLNLRGLCTFYFLLDGDSFAFEQARPSLQPTHPVIEATCGLDLVNEQLLVAGGEKLRFRQRGVESRGHAIAGLIHTTRLGADSVPNLPSAKTSGVHLPGGAGIRIDAALPTRSDSAPVGETLLARITASGDSRELTIRRLRAALAETRLDGLRTTLPSLQQLLYEPAFLQCEADLHWLEQALQAARVKPSDPSHRA